MATVLQPKRIAMTWEEFCRLPEGPPFYDYIHGEAIEVNRPTGKHQHIVMRLSNRLWEHVHSQDIGEVYPDIDVVLPTQYTVGPDIAFVARERLDLYDEIKGDLYGAPDLIVEVLSPSNAAYDRVEKFVLYQQAQVPWVWFVDQESLAIEEFQWTPDGYLWIGAIPGGQPFKPRMFPNFEVNLSDLFKA